MKRALPKLGDEFPVPSRFIGARITRDRGGFVLSGKPALMTIFENEGRWHASNVWFKAGEIHRYDKELRTPEMRHIDNGIAVLSAAVFASFPDNVPFDLAEAYSCLVSEKQMAAYEVTQRFYEIGSREGLAESIPCCATNQLASRHELFGGTSTGGGGNSLQT